MTFDETAKIIAIIKEYYPRDIEATNIKSRVKAWWLALQDYDYNIVQQAVIAFATQDTKGFSPSVGQIVDKILQLTNKDAAALTEMEAWGLVRKAVSRSSYYAQEEFDKLPELVQKIVGFPNQLKEWAQSETGEFGTVIQSNFMRSYKAKAAKQQEYNALPSSVKELIQGVTDRLSLKGGVD